jgi:hypothetical protein
LQSSGRIVSKRPNAAKTACAGAGIPADGSKCCAKSVDQLDNEELPVNQALTPFSAGRAPLASFVGAMLVFAIDLQIEWRA